MVVHTETWLSQESGQVVEGCKVGKSPQLRSQKGFHTLKDVLVYKDC